MDRCRHRLVFASVLLLVCKAAMAAPSCGTVNTAVEPCLPFLKGEADATGPPSEACCLGTRQVNELAKSNDDKVAICNCAKDSLLQFGDYLPSRIPLIPLQCGLPFNLPPIDKDFDCSTISSIWKPEF